MLEPLSRVAARPPRDADRAAARIAAAALAGRPEAAQQALDQLESALARDLPPVSAVGHSGDLLEQERSDDAMLPLAIDLANAASLDARQYRDSARLLLARKDLNPAHRARLEQAVADDPLHLANARILEVYESLWAQTFNAVSAPLGRSLLTGLVTAPYEIAMSTVHYLARLLERPAISIQERQALVHWELFLARNGDAEEAPRVRERAASAHERLARTHRDHFVRSGALALAHGQPRLAIVQAERALDHAPGDDAAKRLLSDASEAVEQHRRLRRASVSWTSDDAGPYGLDARSTRIARELLVGDGEALARSLRRALDETGRRDPLRDELEFAAAVVQQEQGYESAAWERLDSLARRDPAASNMARHAAASLVSAEQNPYRAFRRGRARGRSAAVASEVLGRWAQGPRYRALPAEVAYLIDAPAIAQTALSTPFRLLLSPLQSRPPIDFQRNAAVSAYRYLERLPTGEHARELVDWLYEYEIGRGNAIAALRLADAIPDFDPDRRSELAERAAAQQLEGAARTGRRDLRSMLLRQVVREFPDSQAGSEAGLLARREAEDATPQRIRLTRGFLFENPQIVSARGLGLDPVLLDGEVRNGELHPRGITFLGGRWLEFALVAESGDEEDEPETRQERVSAERLARTAAILDEAATLGVHLDADDTQDVDGSRDLYLERARLGLTDEVDARPTAYSSYVYRGLRERYGAVRGRESILPFDLVLQGSLSDLRLGAFPRWRQPEETPDAFLYR